MSSNIRALCGRQGVENSLLTALESAAEADGTPSEPGLRQLALDYRLSTAAVLGTASFYDFLAPRHRGKRGYVCTGTACLLAGRQDEARERLRASLADDEIGEMACLGRCHRGGAFQLDGDQFDAADLANIWVIWSLAYGTGQLVNGLISDRIGGRAIMLMGAAGTIVCNFVFGFSSFVGTLTSFGLIALLNGWFQ